jgi:Sec-independent protein translocase protein TatA
MIALIFNAGWMELMLVAVIAVLVFGRDLPHVAAKAFVHLQRLRRGVQQVWRDTGISQEMRNLSRQLEENERKARVPLESARRIQTELREQVEKPAHTPRASTETPRSASEPADAAADEARQAPTKPAIGAPVPGTLAVGGEVDAGAAEVERPEGDGKEEPR